MGRKCPLVHASRPFDDARIADARNRRKPDGLQRHQRLIAQEAWRLSGGRVPDVDPLMRGAKKCSHDVALWHRVAECLSGTSRGRKGRLAVLGACKVVDADVLGQDGVARRRRA